MVRRCKWRWCAVSVAPADTTSDPGVSFDCSGFTQLVYKINGVKLKRDASDQALQGQTLSFIEESEPGDLAFLMIQKAISHM